jgi:hypothetical protein
MYLPPDVLHKGLILGSYVVITLPAAWVVRISLRRLLDVKEEGRSTDGADRAGRWIGIFERVIILTFVLLGQFEAIGFLITGKAILRMGSEGRTEYVLAGTMLSYMIAILVGVAVTLPS